MMLKLAGIGFAYDDERQVMNNNKLALQANIIKVRVLGTQESQYTNCRELIFI